MKKIKWLIFVAFFLQIIFFSSCNKEIDYPIDNVQIIEELSIFYCKKDQNELIGDNEIVNKIIILNSKEDAINNFTESFLDSYPEYLQIDYNKYSVLVRTAPVDYNIINRNISLLFYKTSNSYQYYIDYLVGDVCDVNDYYIERTAIVIDKILSHSKIEVGSSISKKVSKEKKKLPLIKVVASFFLLFIYSDIYSSLCFIVERDITSCISKISSINITYNPPNVSEKLRFSRTFPIE